jgi:hypothetical protein
MIRSAGIIGIDERRYRSYALYQDVTGVTGRAMG